MPDTDITRILHKMDELQTEMVRSQKDITYMRIAIDEIREENKARDQHIHRLEIAKREAWAVAGFLGLVIGLIAPLVK